jgi:hypothetical protein
MPKKTETDSQSLPTAIGTYALMAAEEAEIAQVIRLNAGAGTLSPFDLDRVRVPAGGGLAWEVPTLDGERSEPEIEGVLVYWRDQRSYWRQSFDETGGGTPPDCSSHDGVRGVGDPGGLCAECPMAAWGSAPRGQGQACRQTRMLMMIREEDLLPIVIGVPPTSLGPIRKFFLRLASHQVPFYAVVTRLRLRKQKSRDGITYSQIEPVLARRLSLEEGQRIRRYAEGLRPAFERVEAESSDFAG